MNSRQGDRAGKGTKGDRAPHAGNGGPARQGDPSGDGPHARPYHLRPRSREGPSLVRPSSPAWDVTNVRVRREAKERFDAFRFARSSAARVLPHWEAFEALLDEAGF